MNSSRIGSTRFLKWYAVVLVFLFCIFLQSEVYAFTLKVKDKEGNPVNGFRWLVEEDTTNVVTPGVFSSRTLGVNIHGTYAPVKLKGRSNTNTATIDVSPNKRWFVSVLPDAAADGSPRFTSNGHIVEKGAENIKVVVNNLPIPTAQASVYIFHDNAPLNNTPDIGESGLGNFSILVYDQFGQVSQDAFGNLLGTEYNPDGSVKSFGNGIITTCIQAEVDAWQAWKQNPVGDAPRECNVVGEAAVRNLVPGKYGIRADPPIGETWVQTSTIEGTPGVDVWIKSNEPRQLFEFGPGLWHVFHGFVQPFDNLQTLRDACLARPPICDPVTLICPLNCLRLLLAMSGGAFGINQLSVVPGAFVSECWIGLNALEAGATVGVYAAPCNADSTFTISGLPVGTYQLVAWDRPLDYIFFFSTFFVDDLGTPVNLTDQVFMNAWFGNLEGFVFYDTNQNGFRDPGEAGIDNQNLNLRWRDGSMYQPANPTDINGEYGFNEVFPLFKYYVIEVDFARFKATGATITVDKGGPVDLAVLDGKLSPRPGSALRPILMQAIANYGLTGLRDWRCIMHYYWSTIIFTGDNLPGLNRGNASRPRRFADQTNVIDWARSTMPEEKTEYLVVYATTREDDPHYFHRGSRAVRGFRSCFMLTE
jgi:hypothetical protein